jgi:hypothetical protein
VRLFSIFLAMLYHQNAKIIVLQSGPCRPLKALDNFFDLLLRRLVFRGKGNHRRRVRTFVPQTVHQIGKKYRVPPPHDHLFGRSFLQQISHRFLARFPRPQKFDVHSPTFP